VIKDLDAFAFDGAAINEGLVRSLHDGSFLAGRRNGHGQDPPGHRHNSQRQLPARLCKAR